MDILSYLRDLLHWIQSNETTLWVLFIVSVVTFVGTLILIPVLVVRIPHNYFARRGRHRQPWSDFNPVWRILFIGLKNVLGLILIVAGMFMLVLPGQGILTILIGMMLLNFPGKFRLERWLISRRPVFRSINWLRQSRGREPLAVDDDLRRKLKKD